MAKTIPFKRIAASGASDRGDAAIYDLLGYQAIAKAGQPQSLTGESVIQLGALIAQMDFDDPIEEEVAEETKKPEDKSIRQRLEEMNNPGITTSLIDLGTKEIKLLQPNDRPSETTTTKENPGLTITESSGTNIGGISGDAKSDQVNYTIGNIGTEEGRASGENYMYGNNKVTIGKENKTEQEKRFDRGYFLQGEEKAYAAYRKKKTGKDIDTISYGDTPMGRLNPKVLNLLKPFRYSKVGIKDTPFRRVVHAVSSPVLKTEGLNYGQIKRAVMPGYAQGRLGSAAAEGFNLVADAYNYSQAVKAEYDKELDYEFGELDVDATFTDNQSRQDYLNLALQKKKELAKGFNDYARGKMSKLEYENLKTSLVSDIQNIASVKTKLTDLRKTFQENKDNYDVAASKPQMVDFYNTLDKYPQRLSIKNIDGVDRIVGKTIEGEDISVPVSDIANGTAGFRLAKKESLDGIVASADKAVNDFNKGKEYVKTEFGFGTQDITPDKAKEIAVNHIKSKLASDKDKLRSYMSQLGGVDYNTYNELLDQGNLPDEFLTDAANDLYQQRLAPFYQPQTQTTRFQQSQGGGASTAGERERAKFVKSWNSAPLPNKNNIESAYTGLLGDKYAIRKTEDGDFGIVNKDKPGDGLLKIDMSLPPTQIKQKLLEFARFRVQPNQTTPKNYEQAYKTYLDSKK